MKTDAQVKRYRWWPALRIALSVAGVMLLSVVPIAPLRGDSGGAAPPVAPVPPGTTTLSDAQLQTLVAPIALYPDPLIAQILPASTYPLEVVLAERWLQANPNPPEAAIVAENLEPSIEAMLHYPTVLAMMNEQLEWTQSLGVAFLNQQPALMNAIQQLRLQAQQAGALQNTPQQQVVMDDADVEILPVDPNLIYVPQYDPNTYYQGGAFLAFGNGYPEGLWLDNNVDWGNGWVSGGNGWHHGWDRPGNGRVRPGEGRPITRPWARDRGQPLPVRGRAPTQEAGRAARPGYENPAARGSGPAAFGGYQNHAGVQRSVNRAQQSHPAPQAARPAPRAAPTQAFRAEGSGRAVAAQSARGNASRGGGGGGGGRGRK